MKNVVEKVSPQKGIAFDRMQYIVYEIICSSLLLIMLNESSKANYDDPIDLLQIIKNLMKNQQTAERQSL